MAEDAPRFFPRRRLGRTGFIATALGIGDVADRSVPLDECVRTVGRALEGRRNGIFLIDKVDVHDEPVLTQVEANLQRLGLDHADCFLFHGLSTVVGWGKLAAPGGAMEQLGQCIRKGTSRFRGISSHHPGVRGWRSNPGCATW